MTTPANPRALDSRPALIIDALFDTAGTFTLQHVTPAQTHTLATIQVDDHQGADSSAARDFACPSGSAATKNRVS